MNIVIPMAGMGSRFSQEGYDKPKPFIDVDGIPMIMRVLDNLKVDNASYFLIARKEHLDKEPSLVKEIENKYNVTFIPIDKLTEGTACTVLYARRFIDNDKPLLIANSDQLVDFDINIYIDDCISRKLDGSILSFIDDELNPKWSFAKLDQEGLVCEVKEKEPISKFATVGIYYFSNGQSFVGGAIDMIINNDRVNNEFYTCPVYNYLILQKLRIGIFNILPIQMHGIGTPDDLNTYLKKIKKR
jgi:NDP-sugar pyrophosphorylase family protein